MYGDFTNEKIFYIFVNISFFYTTVHTGALYNPEQEKEIFSRFDKMILFQNKLASQKKNQSTTKNIHELNLEMTTSQEYKNSLLVDLIDNFFILDFYENIVQFMRDDFKRKDIGMPYLSQVKFIQPFKCYVFKEEPEKDSDIYIDNIVKTFESNLAVKHFDQQFRISIYQLLSGKGLMIVRGKYVFIDANLNGIPEEIYLMYKYKNSKRDFIPYLSLLAEGENVLQDSAYHSRFRDTLIVGTELYLRTFSIRKFT